MLFLTVNTNVLSFTKLLPSSVDIIKSLNRIVEAFNNPVEIEVVKIRWEEIKIC